VVVVKDTELLAEANDATGASRCKFSFQLVHELVGALICFPGGVGGGNFLIKETSREFFVVNASRAILVVNAEKGIKVLFGGDHDTNLLDSFGELIRLNAAIIVEIKVLEALDEDILLALVARCLLR